MAEDFKTLQFSNTAKGQQLKVTALRQHAAEGWHVVSETVTSGQIKAGQACCLTSGGFCCAGPFLAPLGFFAGRTTGTITVTLSRTSVAEPPDEDDDACPNSDPDAARP